MFGIFKRKSVIDAVIDPEKGHLSKIGAFIGKQQFTDQERAEMMTGVSEAVREFSIAVAKQGTERSKITREIAILWIKCQLAVVLVSVISVFNNDPRYFEAFWSIATSDVLMWGTFGVMTYLFGAYGWGAHIKGKK